jgi:hypothetical protein
MIGDAALAAVVLHRDVAKFMAYIPGFTTVV